MNPVVNMLIVCALIMFHAPSFANPQWYPGWQQTTAMNVQRAGAAVLESNGRIYVIGGIDGIRFLDSSEYSTIQNGGTLSNWKMTSPLNEERGFFAAVEHHGFIYIAGGGNGPNGGHYLQSVERAKILADGSLGPWITEPATLNYPRRCAKLVVAGNMLYALGGFSGTLLDTVERAEIRKDGSLGKWSLEQNRMTMPRYINAIKKYHNTVYAIGGHNQNEGSGLTEVEFASFDKPYALGVWRRTTPMQIPRYALASAAHGNFVYALGGLNGAIYSDAIEKGLIGPQGEIQTWQTTTPLSSLRANFGTVMFEDRIYIIGGTNRDGYYNTVEVAGFNNTGDIGFMATPQQIASIKNNSLAKTGGPDLLPNTGIVKQIIHTQLYSYIEVSLDGNDQWLAAPRSDFAVNDSVKFSTGLTMTGFHSKALQRDFPSIIFVERIQQTASDPVP